MGFGMIVLFCCLILVAIGLLLILIKVKELGEHVKRE